LTSPNIARLPHFGCAGYRLLSEAEWEYVTRAGTKTRYIADDTITNDQAGYNSICVGVFHTGEPVINTYIRTKVGIERQLPEGMGEELSFVDFVTYPTTTCKPVARSSVEIGYGSSAQSRGANYWEMGAGRHFRERVGR
jgi:hypothetical protein